MLLDLVGEFESSRGEILNLFAKIKKDQLLRAPTVGKHNSTRVHEGRKNRNLFGNIMQTKTAVGRGVQEHDVCPGSE